MCSWSALHFLSPQFSNGTSHIVLDIYWGTVFLYSCIRPVLCPVFFLILYTFLKEPPTCEQHYKIPEGSKKYAGLILWPCYYDLSWCNIRTDLPNCLKANLCYNEAFESMRGIKPFFIYFLIPRQNW